MVVEMKKTIWELYSLNKKQISISWRLETLVTTLFQYEETG